MIFKKLEFLSDQKTLFLVRSTPEGWDNINNETYILYVKDNVAKDYLNAVQFCKDKRGRLFEPRNMSLFQEVHEKLREVHINIDSWRIGIQKFTGE